MAESYTLDAQPRTLIGKKVGRLRREGLVPAVIYGAHVQPVAIQVPYRVLETTLAKAGGTHLIEVSVGGERHAVLARDVQRDVMRRDITHVDFLEVDMNQPVRTIVPVHIVGESPAVASRIGLLFHGLNTVEVEALPADLVDSVRVDISNLREIGDTLHVSDLVVGPRVTIHAEPEELVVRINPVPTVVEEAGAEEEEAASAEPELIRREREDEEEE